MQIKLGIRPEAWAELNAIADKHLLLSGENSARKITDKITRYVGAFKNKPSDTY